LYDDKLDELLPAEHDGIVGNEAYKHVPEGNGDGDNVTVELLFVVDNHVPNIGSKYNKNGDK
jgi:hypothetical protein